MGRNLKGFAIFGIAVKEPDTTPGETSTYEAGVTAIGQTGAGIAEPSVEYGWTPKPTERYTHVRMVIAGVPASKIADVNRGILLPFSQAVGNFAFTLTIDIESAEGIDRATLENKVKETIRQIGARLEEERLS